MLTESSTPATKARCCCERHREELALFGSRPCFSLTIMAHDHFSHARVYVTDQLPPMSGIQSAFAEAWPLTTHATAIGRRKRAAVRLVAGKYPHSHAPP